MKLVLAEKPSVAQSIAKVLGVEFIDEVTPEEKEEFDLAAMDYMDSVALELVV